MSLLFTRRTTATSNIILCYSCVDYGSNVINHNSLRLWQIIVLVLFFSSNSICLRFFVGKKLRKVINIMHVNTQFMTCSAWYRTNYMQHKNAICLNSSAFLEHWQWCKKKKYIFVLVLSFSHSLHSIFKYYCVSKPK